MQRGYTLIEAIIVLAIAGLLIAGVWLYSSSSINAAKKNKLAEQTIQIMANTRNVLQNAPNATGLDIGPAINAGIIPADMVRGPTAAAHAFNDAVTLVANTDASLVNLTLSNIPGDACIDLVSGRLAATAEAAAQFGISSITIAGTDVTTADGFGTANSNTKIATNCGNNVANILITFGAN